MAIKKNDTVKVMSGRDRGKIGAVVDVVPAQSKVIVQGVNLVKCHAKARKQGDVAGIVTKEAYIAISNVMPVCPSCKKPCRTKKVKSGEGLVRACCRCENAF